MKKMLWKAKGNIQSMELKDFYCRYYLLMESEIATHSVFLAGKKCHGQRSWQAIVRGVTKR